MKLAAMRYKDYVWPHNPRTYTIDYQRNVAVQKVPFGRYHLQDLGLTRRVMRGEGEFVGEGAYDEFKRLASVFYLPGPGPLIHPVWQAAEVYFVDLSLRQEPRADYVAYSFTLWASSTAPGTQAGTLPTSNAGSGTAGQGSNAGTAGNGGGGGAAYHTVEAGETLWGIARDYGLSLTALMEKNPQIKNPNLMLVGVRERVA